MAAQHDLMMMINLQTASWWFRVFLGVQLNGVRGKVVSEFSLPFSYIAGKRKNRRLRRCIGRALRVYHFYSTLQRRVESAKRGHASTSRTSSFARTMKCKPFFVYFGLWLGTITSVSMQASLEEGGLSNQQVMFFGEVKSNIFFFKRQKQRNHGLSPAF